MIRILIAEPMTLTREGLVALLGRENDIELAAAVRHREEVVINGAGSAPGRRAAGGGVPGPGRHHRRGRTARGGARTAAARC